MQGCEPHVLKVLTEDWQLCQSKRFPDKVYYFHTKTGLSTWDPPPELEGFFHSSTAECLPAFQQSDSSFELQDNEESSESTDDSDLKTNKDIQETKKGILKPPLSHQTTKSVTFSTENKINFIAPVQKVNKTDLKPSEVNEIDNISPPQKRKRIKIVRNNFQLRFSPNKSPSMTDNSKSHRTAIVAPVNVNYIKPSSSTIMGTNNQHNLPSTSTSSIFPSSSLERFIPTMSSQSKSCNKVESVSTQSSSNKIISYSYIIVDASILIYELKFVTQTLKDLPIDFLPPTIYVPNIVIQELNRLKVKSSEGYLAATALEYLDNPCRIKIQSLSEFQAETEELNLTKDISYKDRLLQSCAQLSKRASIKLLTNDEELLKKGHYLSIPT